MIKENRYQILLDALKHPVTLLILGFFLTSVLGNMIARNVTQAQEDRAKEEHEKELRLQSIDEITTLFYERYTWSMLLASSLKRNANLTELAERKKKYDDVYARWNIRLVATQLRIREISNSKDYSLIEAHVQYGLVPHLSAIDAHLTAVYDCRLKECNDLKYDSEKMRSELDICLSCSYVIADYLWKKTSFVNDQSLVDESLNNLRRRCPLQITSDE